MKNFFSLYTWIVLLGICLFRANCEEAKPPEEKDQEWRLCTLFLKSGITFKGLVLDHPKMTVQYDNGGMILPFDRDKIEKIEPLSAEEAEQVLAEITKRRGWTEEKRKKIWEAGAPEREKEKIEATERAKIRDAKEKLYNDIAKLNSAIDKELKPLYKERNNLENVRIAILNRADELREESIKNVKLRPRVILEGTLKDFYKYCDTKVDIFVETQDLTKYAMKIKTLIDVNEEKIRVREEMYK